MEIETTAPGRSTITLFQPSRDRLARLGAWFEAEYPALLRFAYFVTGDRAAAEDVVQESFVRLYRSSSRIDDGAFPAYARRTIANLGRSGFRRLGRERRALERAGGGGAEPGRADEVWDAVLRLSPKQRACVALRFYEDLSEAEVARTLGVSAGAVKKHTSRAMEKLRASLGERREP